MHKSHPKPTLVEAAALATADDESPSLQPPPQIVRFTSKLLSARGFYLAAVYVTIYGALNLLVQRLANQWSPTFVGFEVIFLALTAFLPVIAAWTLRWINELALPVSTALKTTNGVDAQNWFEEQRRTLFAPKWLFASSLFLIILGMYSAMVFGVPWRGWVLALFYMVCALFFAGYGMFGYVFAALSLLAWRSGSLEVRATVFRWPHNDLNLIYRIFFRFVLLGTWVYALAVLSVWISPGGDFIALHTGLGRFWVFPPALFIIVFLMVFHFRIHSLLRRCKHQADEQLTSFLEAAYEQWRSGGGAVSETTVTAVINWREHIREVEEWPTSTRTIVVTVTTLLLPTIEAFSGILH